MAILLRPLALISTDPIPQAKGEVKELAADCHRTVACLEFSPDGMTLAVSYLDFTIGIWDVATGEKRNTISTQSDQVHSLVFSPDGKTLASGGEQRSIRLWNVASPLGDMPGCRSSVGLHGSTAPDDSARTIPGVLLSILL
jgi:WD40 repeat protein